MTCKRYHLRQLILARFQSKFIGFPYYHRAIIRLAYEQNNSLRYLNREFHQMIEKHYWKGVLWLPSNFAASCGGAPICIVREYIKKQSTPDEEP